MNPSANFTRICNKRLLLATENDAKAGFINAGRSFLARLQIALSGPLWTVGIIG